MNAKMYYYISKDIKVTGSSFANTLVKRFDTFADAEAYLKTMVEEWTAAGLSAKTMDIDGEAWMAQATNEEFCVVHMYHIFATPVFMAGGEEGL